MTIAQTGKYCLKHVNEKGEMFHLHILANPAHISTSECNSSSDKCAMVQVTEETPCSLPIPVLLCVHGAGMSGDNFTRLAEQLCQSLQYNEEHMEHRYETFINDSTPAHSCATSKPVSNDANDSNNNDNNNNMNCTIAHKLPCHTHTHTQPLLPLHPLGKTKPMLRNMHTPIAPARQPVLPNIETSSEASKLAESTADNDNTSGIKTTMIRPGNQIISSTVCTSVTTHGLPSMFVVSYDLRCHGQSTFNGGEDTLTLEVLANDFVSILLYLHRLFPLSPFYILGHSLGGAIVANALSRKQLVDNTNGNSFTGKETNTIIEINNNHSNNNNNNTNDNDDSKEHMLSESKHSWEFVAGVILLDVVEGTARASLQHMNDFLSRRPSSFASTHDAVKWFLRFGGMHSVEGAEVSVPPLLKCVPLHIALPPPSRLHSSSSSSESSSFTIECRSSEENERCKEQMYNNSKGERNAKKEEQWVWRSDLHKMEKVWDDWFVNLDAAFVGLPFPKMLCLANMERLDTELIVAQMQGKFQFEVMGNNCGHYIMDDAPTALAYKIQRFVKRIEGMKETLQQKLRQKPH